LKIGIPNEISADETRVAIIPDMVANLIKDGRHIFVESGAGLKASFSDEMFKKNGAEIVSDSKSLFKKSELVVKFQAPRKNETVGKHEIEMMNDGGMLICSLPPLAHAELIPMLNDKKNTCFAMEYIPRITRAQSMDVLSSMATVAGYKAVLLAAHHLGRFFPLLMTAAGTIPPATVLVLGAGVAGLQAIATAKRLGARVEAFDPRPAVKEQVESLGAHFVEMEMPEDAETAGGYAKEQSEAFLEKEREAIAAKLTKTDALISTAQIFGKEAPLLVTTEMVKMMKPGSVVIDLAAAEGGNCELSEPNKTLVKHDVTIYGAVNLAKLLPVHASQMHSKNVITLIKHLFQNDGLDFEDEITKGTCITHNGEIINEMVKKKFNEES